MKTKEKLMKEMPQKEVNEIISDVLAILKKEKAGFLLLGTKKKKGKKEGFDGRFIGFGVSKAEIFFSMQTALGFQNIPEALLGLIGDITKQKNGKKREKRTVR